MSDLTIITGLSESQGTCRETQEMMILEQVGQAWGEKYQYQYLWKTSKTDIENLDTVYFTLQSTLPSEWL